MAKQNSTKGIPQTEKDLLMLNKLQTFFYKIVYDNNARILLVNYSNGYIASKYNVKEFTEFIDLQSFIYNNNLYAKDEHVVNYKSIETQISKSEINLFKKDD
jgi:hypothetical protein